MINDFFDQIYCINLDRRPDRWQECKHELDLCGIEAERISAIDGNPDNIQVTATPPHFVRDGLTGLALTHLKIIKDAKEKGYNKILILEDDIVFTTDFHSKFNLYIKELPDDWRLLYASGSHWGISQFINEHTVELINTYTTHFLGIQKDMFDIIIERLENRIDNPIDVIYAEWQKQYPAYCIVPHLCWQRKGYSDIANQEVDYKVLEEFRIRR